jgi:hypothetical protein
MATCLRVAASAKAGNAAGGFFQHSLNHASGSCHATWNSLRILSLPLLDACRAETRHLSYIQIIPVGGIVVPNTAEIIWKE